MTTFTKIDLVWNASAWIHGGDDSSLKKGTIFNNNPFIV